MQSKMTEKVTEGQNVASRKDSQQSADWSFPESPLDLACTFLLSGLPLGKFCGPVPIGWLGGRFVDALLHPLHDQVEQRYHRLVHLCSCRCTRLKVRDSVSNKNVHLMSAPQPQRGFSPLHYHHFPNNPIVIKIISTGFK